MDFPAAAYEQWPQAMHDPRQNSVEQYRPAHGNFNFHSDHLHSQRIEQNAGVKRHRQHEWKRQCDRAVKNQHRHDVNVRVVEPWQRRNEKLGYLRN